MAGLIDVCYDTLHILQKALFKHALLDLFRQVKADKIDT